LSYEALKRPIWLAFYQPATYYRDEELLKEKRVHIRTS
jgi:hypothetical protein